MADGQHEVLDPRTALDGLAMLFLVLSGTRPIDYDERRKWVMLRRQVYQQFGRDSPQSAVLDTLFDPHEVSPWHPATLPTPPNDCLREDLADIGLFLVDAVARGLTNPPLP